VETHHPLAALKCRPFAGRCMRGKKLGPYTKKKGDQTTPFVYKLKARFKIVHPFHPLSGKEFETVDYHNVWLRRCVSFLDDQGAMRLVPLEWTDVDGVDPFVELSCGRSYFRVMELLRLVDLLDDLNKAKRAGETREM